MLLLLAFVADCCWAQTVVYTTGQNGEISAYLVVNNTTDTTNSPPTSSRSSSGGQASIQAATASNLSITTISPTSSPSTIVLPNTPYSGQSLLTGTCTIPLYTALQYADGHFIEVPLIGCSDDRPECCPSLALTSSVIIATESEQSNLPTATATSPSLTPTGVISMLSQAPLTVCPSDMVDMDPVCCPRGFTKWGQAILGNTPCASLLSTSYTVPSSVLESITSYIAASVTLPTGSSGATSAPAVVSESVNIIVNQVFALGLPCADGKEEHGLSTGAKAGIGVGVGMGALLLILLSGWAFILVKRHRKIKSEAPRETPTASPAFPVDPKTGAITSTEHMSHTPQMAGFPAQMPQNIHWTASAHPQDPVYGQGFVDGVRAALSPYQSPPQSPPPFYGVHRTNAIYPPAEVPAASIRQEGSVDTAAELSAYERNTQSSVAYNNSVSYSNQT